MAWGRPRLREGPSKAAPETPLSRLIVRHGQPSTDKQLPPLLGQERLNPPGQSGGRMCRGLALLKSAWPSEASPHCPVKGPAPEGRRGPQDKKTALPEQPAPLCPMPSAAGLYRVGPASPLSRGGDCNSERTPHGELCGGGQGGGVPAGPPHHAQASVSHPHRGAGQPSRYLQLDPRAFSGSGSCVPVRLSP